MRATTLPMLLPLSMYSVASGMPYPTITQYLPCTPCTRYSCMRTTTLPMLLPLSMYSMASGTALKPVNSCGSIHACSLPSACSANTRFRAVATLSLPACAHYTFEQHISNTA